MWALDEFDDEIDNNIQLCSKCNMNPSSEIVRSKMAELNLKNAYIDQPYHYIHNYFNGNNDAIDDYYSSRPFLEESEYCLRCYNTYYHNHLIYDKHCMNELKCVCCSNFKLNIKRNWVKNIDKSLEVFKYARKIIRNSFQIHRYVYYYRNIGIISDFIRSIRRSGYTNKFSFIESVNTSRIGSYWACKTCYINTIQEKKSLRIANRFKVLPFQDYIDDDIKQKSILSLKRLSADVLDCKLLAQLFINFNIENMY